MKYFDVINKNKTLTAHGDLPKKKTYNGFC